MTATSHVVLGNYTRIEAHMFSGANGAIVLTSNPDITDPDSTRTWLDLNVHAVRALAKATANLADAMTAGEPGVVYDSDRGAL